MQVSRRALLPERLWPDQADSANALFHRRPVRSAMSTVGVGNDHDDLSWMDKRLNQFSVSNGDDDTASVTTDDALLGFTANHRAAATYAPHNTVRWLHSYQQHSAPFETSTAGPWDSQGARPKNKRPTIPDPAHLNADICRGLNHTGIDPWFIARHTQDDYYQNPERVAAELNNRIVHMNSSMREPFTGYDARPLLPDHSEVNGGLPGQNWADPPRHVTVGADYCGLPLADIQPQQSGNPKYSASKQAAALLNPPTGTDGGFLPAQTGSDSSFSPLATSEKEVKTTDISTTVTANCEQRVNEPASGSSSSDMSLTSTASFNTANCESDSDDSLKELEARVEEACAMVERVLREREEREDFQESIKRKEDEIKAKRKREQQAREARELEISRSWPAQQDAVTTKVQWHCEHYQRRCRVKFECCDVFYPCHRCHNLSKNCSNEKVHAYDATHYKCSQCKHEEKIDENSHHCSRCKVSMAAYFCSVCKHFTSADKTPYHCEKCGICRIHKEKSFHCDVCNVCLDKRLENNHKCRPDSGHDECPICLEDAFSGCQILPCSHKVHRECAVMMIQNGVRNCPLCRHPIYSAAPEHN